MIYKVRYCLIRNSRDNVLNENASTGNRGVFCALRECYKNERSMFNILAFLGKARNAFISTHN